MLRAIFLDFDGIIVESVDIKTQAFRELFSIYPEHVDRIVAYHLANNAKSRYVKFRHIFTHILKRPYDTSVESECDRKLSAIVFNKIVACPPVPGAPEFLEYFHSRVPMFLVSATPGKEIERILAARGIRHYFTEVAGAPGDKVDQIRAILEQHRIQQQDAVYIGDMREDAAVARLANIRFIGREHVESFRDLDALTFPDMYGIRGWIVENL